ncbi:glutathione S-transferase [Diaporthe sp. PMI_573]|nr:glutathione S-transferase [Diaporthaceae sp. PMI_573]
MSTFPSDKAPKPGLNIYGCASVNPYKMAIAAEELGIPYNYIALDMGAGELTAEWFKSVNPNGRAPAIVHIKEDGTTVKVFESAACLLYLASEFDKERKISWELGTPEYWMQLSWLSWQVAGYGPMMGQACHFNRYSPEQVPYGSWRYTAEARRLNHVLNEQLATSDFVAGNRLTIADIAIFIFAHSNKWCGVDINECPHVKAWHDKLLERPSFQKALQIPVPYQFSDVAVSAPEAQDFYKTIRKYGTQMIKGATEQWKGEVVPVPSDHANLEVTHT